MWTFRNAIPVEGWKEECLKRVTEKRKTGGIDVRFGGRKREKGGVSSGATTAQSISGS